MSLDASLLMLMVGHPLHRRRRLHQESNKTKEVAQDVVGRTWSWTAVTAGSKGWCIRSARGLD